MRYIHLHPVKPTPSDIAIAKSAHMKEIKELAEEVRSSMSSLTAESLNFCCRKPSLQALSLENVVSASRCPHLRLRGLTIGVG